jgi:hypothetical protein
LHLVFQSILPSDSDGNARAGYMHIPDIVVDRERVRAGHVEISHAVHKVYIGVEGSQRRQVLQRYVFLMDDWVSGVVRKSIGATTATMAIPRHPAIDMRQHII